MKTIAITEKCTLRYNTEGADQTVETRRTSFSKGDTLKVTKQFADTLISLGLAALTEAEPSRYMNKIGVRVTPNPAIIMA